MSGVEVVGGMVVMNGVECREADVVAYFAELPEDQRVLMAVRALSLGVAGLNSVGVASQVEVVEREFRSLTEQFERALGDMEQQIMEKVDLRFDPDRADSVAGRLGVSITEAFSGTSRVLDTAKSDLAKLVEDSFNPDLSTSSVYRLVQLVNNTRGEIEKAFDPAYEGSYLARLAGTIDEYFGENGLVSDVLEARIAPVKNELLKQLQELRDLVVRQKTAEEARRLTPASGFDFEDEVEERLRGLAKAYGDSIDCVGVEAGDDGRSKSGDFVVQLREGPRFVVEAKNYSKPINLRGRNGLLATLNGSMSNRAADFAIAVMKESCGYPKEVGLFNDYDGDKLLCAYEDNGDLLEAAYRWARTVLLAQGEAAVDVALVQEGLADARSALEQIRRIDAKAKSIEKSSGEIRQIISFELRRALAALDKAAGGVSAEIKAAS